MKKESSGILIEKHNGRSVIYTAKKTMEKHIV